MPPIEEPSIRRHRLEYPPVGRCIYCRQSDPPLTTEHIIPEALGGVLELPEASCLTCQTTINNYEWTVGRWIFGDFRIRHNIRSKRSKRKRPENIEIEVRTDEGTFTPLTVSRSEYPAPLFMYRFGRPLILAGLPPGTGIFDWVPYAIQDNAAMASFQDRHPNAVYKFRASPFEPARMLAKIGHGYVVASRGLEAFHPFSQNLDTVLCRTDDVAFTVGSNMQIDEPDRTAGHLLSISYAFDPPRAPMILTDIRLFGALPTPTFQVAVGWIDLQNPEHVRALPEDVRDAQAIKSP